MSRKNLEIYLNDHLAGAAGALRHIDRTRKLTRDSSVADALGAIREEVGEDRDVLHDLMKRLDVPRGILRRMTAILGQAASALKFHAAPGAREDLRVLQALDLLSAGIQGKKSLWTALSAATENAPHLAVVDYATMTRRAVDQLELVSRLQAAISRTGLSNALND